MNENQWSKRLVDCLSNCTYHFLQEWEFVFWGTKIELCDFDDMQKYISGIKMSDAVDAYVYHGAPDIIVRSKSSSVIISNLEFEVPRTIENSRQPLKPFTISNICLPQKLGEVIAQIHFLASAYFLQCGNSGNVPHEIATKGLLLDKNSGGYQVELLATINIPSEGIRPVSVCVTVKRQRKLGSLSQGLCCEHLKKLFG